MLVRSPPDHVLQEPARSCQIVAVVLGVMDDIVCDELFEWDNVISRAHVSRNREQQAAAR